MHKALFKEGRVIRIQKKREGEREDTSMSVCGSEGIGLGVNNQ